MMLKPLQPITRAQTAVSLSVPSPVGGWNARDSLDSMAPEDAVALDNWFPREGWVETRGGSSLHCNTAEGTQTGSLHVSNINGTQNMIAGLNGKLVKTTTSTPSTLGSGFSSNIWKSANFRARIFLVGPGNAPQDWDGTTLTSTSWSGSGLTITNLIDVTVYRSRLYFIEQNTPNLWYGGTDAVTGTLTKFVLSGQGNAGGKLVGFATITSDGGDGPDDLFAFFMSSGDVILYSGSDPGDSSWTRIGVFQAGPLAASGSCRKIGSDIVVINQDGFIPLTRVFPFGRNVSARQTISDKISNAATFAVQRYASNNGWDIILYPKGDKLIFNVPRSATRFDQYVMNINTGAWCRFRGWNGQTFCVMGNNLYYGSTDGKIYQADTGTNDADAAISSDVQTAWNYFGDRSRLKRFTMCRPIFRSEADTGALMALGVDFDSSIPTNTLTANPVSQPAIWDQAIWDQAIWADSLRTSRSWQALNGLGYCASLRLRVGVSDQQVRWFSTNYSFEPGGIL